MLWRAWLGRALGLGGDYELALDVLLGWAALDDRGPELVRTLDERGARAVRDALADYLERRLGAAGPLVWAAWERGQGAAALEMAILAAAVAGVEHDGVRVWWELAAKQVFGQFDAAAMARLGEVSEAALRHVQARAGGADGRAAVARLVAGADARVLDSVRDQLDGSPRLPSAWHARLAALGRALAEGAASPTLEAARRANELRARLSGHMMFGDSDQRAVVERADMAVRILGWLAQRPDRELVRQPTPYAEVECLASWYAAEGGYVDLARRRARRNAGGPLAAGVTAVLEAADRAREELDHAFARALPAYLEARRPATHCLPIDQAFDRIGKRFLDERPERRLLVLLMDGMAWAQAVEILRSLATETAPWGPLVWHATSKHAIGEAPYPPVLANFPTLTEVSRSAFFAGKPMAVGRSHRTGDDPERWKANKTRQGAVGRAGRGQAVLARRGPEQGRLGDRRGAVAGRRHAPPDRGDRDQRDRQLAQGRPEPADRVDGRYHQGLRDLLDKARDVGRTVLLCSDHGHVPADRLEPAGQARQNGARWRVWEKAGDPVAEFEVGLPASGTSGVWAPQGKHGVVLLADDGRKYGGGASAGEHGGASLAEVVAPCLLIGCEDNREIADDPALSVRPLVVPSWWLFEFGGEPAVAVAPEPKRAAQEAGRQPAKPAQDRAAADRRAGARCRGRALASRTCPRRLPRARCSPPGRPKRRSASAPCWPSSSCSNAAASPAPGRSPRRSASSSTASRAPSPGCKKCSTPTATRSSGTTAPTSKSAWTRGSLR